MKKSFVFLFALVLTAMLAVGAFAAETVLYENDFSDPATLSDFSQYRMEWEIRDGGLYLTDNMDPSVSGQTLSTTFSHIIYNNLPAMSDYIVEVDYMNLQTAGGIVFRVDGDSCNSATSDSFYGYFAFVGNAANVAALGSADTMGGWKGNIDAQSAACNVSDNVHIKVTVKGNMIKEEITLLETGKLIYSYTYKIGSSAADAKWVEGTVGLRMRAEYPANNVSSCNTAYFDNFKVTTANEATLSEADYVSPSQQLAASFKKTINTDYLETLYKNTFDSYSSIYDFSQFRGDWEVLDGKLYLTSQGAGAYSFILYDGDKSLRELTDYVLDADIYNVQASGGVIIRADMDEATDESDSSFAGYLGFVSSTGDKFAVGYPDPASSTNWTNAKVSPTVITTGMNIHVQFAVKGTNLQVVVTDLDTGDFVWGYTGTNKLYSKGSFGFRMYGKKTSSGLENLSATGIDNLVISTYGEAPKVTTTEVKLTIGEMTGYVNNIAKKLDAAPIIANSRTMLPVRFLAEAFGAEVGWDGATSTATIKADGVDVAITIGAETAKINGEEVKLDSPAFIENSRTYLPVRVIAEALGAEVAWDGATSTATLTKTTTESK